MKQQGLSVRRPVSAFLSWWLSELAAMVPARLLCLFRRRREQIVLELSDEELIIQRWSAETATEIGRIPMSGPGEAEQRALVQDVLASAGTRRKGATLLLPPARALRKRLSLPAAAEENLHQVLSFEMDRQTPFRAEDVYFDHKIGARRGDLKRIDVELVVLPRITVDQAIERCSRLGLVPDVIGVAWPERHDPNTFNLLPKIGATTARRWSRRLAFGIGMMALGLLAATIYVPLERQRSLAEAFATEAEAAKQEAEGARQLREQIEQAIEQGRLIVLKKMERPSVIHVLDEITRLLGDDTWLIRLRFFGDEVQIFGYSSAASMLIRVIEDSLLFRDAQFRAPVTRDPGVDAERFHLAFKIAAQSPRLADATERDEQGAGR
jgi:general secretion pathway protein L